MANARKVDGAKPLQLRKREDETDEQALARTMLDPMARHAVLSSVFADQGFGATSCISVTGTAAQLEAELRKAAAGDLSMASRILASQAFSLDAIFTELARRSSINMGQHIEAMERYMRLALKAQAASRSTLEALSRLHQPREQTVRHVHVNEGGQAVIAEQFHHHAGGASIMQNHSNNPMQPSALANAPRWRARTRKGSECQSPAVNSKLRCRMHGGTNPGAPVGNQNAWKHGARSGMMLAAGRLLRALGG